MRKLDAGLGAAEARLTRLLEARLQSGVAAKLEEIVVRPGDRRDAEFYGSSHFFSLEQSE